MKHYADICVTTIKKEKNEKDSNYINFGINGNFG